MRLKYAFLFLCILSTLKIFDANCLAQQPGFITEYHKEYLEQTYADDENMYADILEALEFFYENPINLNDTNIDELSKLPFLSEFQIQTLIAYISQNGTMASVYELQTINGFSPQTIHLILPFVCVRKNISKQPFLFRNAWKYGKHSLVSGYKTLIEKQKGYTSISEKDKSTTRYLGSAFRSYLKYEFHYQNKIKLRIGAEKDAGENGIDFYSLSLMLNDFAFIKKMAIGNYDLQFGQGVTLWTGFGYGLPLDGNIKKSGQTIKLSGTFTEYSYLRGLATTLNYKKWYFTSFYSYVKRDASITAINENKQITEVQSILNTGYHRTETEINNKQALAETIFGSNIQYKIKYLHLGATAYKMLLSANLEPQPHLYNIHYFRGTENFSMGADFKALIGRMSFFGELSYSQNGAFAGLTGMQVPMADNSSFNVVYRNYAANYQNLYSSPIGQNSSHSNEKGILSLFQTTLPLNIQMTAIADVFKSPWLRYQINKPSFGQEYRITFAKEIDRNTNVSFRYRYKSNDINTSIENVAIVFTENYNLQSFQINVSYAAISNWIFNSRVEYNFRKAETGVASSGFMMYQDVIFSPQNYFFTLALRYALFNTEEYENRIYTYERDFLHETFSSSYNGKGSRFYIMANFKIRKNMLFGLRYSIWYYPELESIGSSLDEIKGDTKQEIKVQLRLKF